MNTIFGHIFETSFGNVSANYFQGHIYIHNATINENVYSILNILPDGDYFFDAFLYTNINRSECILAETKSYVEIKPKGIERF